MPNYAFTDPGDAVPDGSTIDSGNFMQLLPHTEILKGKALTINGGNWMNVEAQPEWTINGGLWVHRSFCSHVRPDLVEHGLTECETECEHMIDKNEIYIDGALVDTIYHYDGE